MALEVRPYRPEDRDELLDVWAAANRVGHPFFDEAELVARRRRLIEIHLPASETWVAWEAGRIVGGIGLDGAFVGGLFVDPEQHGRGVGRRLLDHATALKGPLTLEVYVANPAARWFYDRCGFIAVERREVDDDGRPWPVVVMTGQGRPVNRAPAGQEQYSSTPFSSKAIREPARQRVARPPRAT